MHTKEIIWAFSLAYPHNVMQSKGHQGNNTAASSDNDVSKTNETGMRGRKLHLLITVILLPKFTFFWVDGVLIK